MFARCVGVAVTTATVCVFLHVFVHTWKKGGPGGGCWMSHIVPARPGDIAGGQSGMEPERGDSDK